MTTQKTTSEIRALLINAKLDFESVVNRALNDYLPKNISKLPIYKRAVHHKAVWNVRSSKVAQINETHWRSSALEKFNVLKFRRNEPSNKPVKLVSCAEGEVVGHRLSGIK